MRIRTVTLLASALCLSAGTTGALALPAFTTATKSKVAAPSTPQAKLVAITVGTRPAFDRIVFRFAGSTPGYNVTYVPAVIQDGSGLPVSLLGRKFLQIRFEPTVNGTSQNAPTTLTPRFATLRQVKRAGDFEGVLNYGAGLSKRVGFRVFTLTGPRRIVIDVAR